MSETEVNALREQIKQYVNAADERILRIVFTILEMDSEKDWWDELPQQVKDSIDEGIRDVEEGHIISHEDFLKRNEQWLKK
ncbi:MAG: hypothetical protein ICV84_10975 [Flavisolibacter sp.]|nr:hypothetical protein [Flavisolibacter sp.]MBD0295700.1 hypothetical protein [Flavisolibacter sp.]